MRIGVYGGIANNMYVFAKALSGAGAEVCFIRDRSDHYPMSQPVWEDSEFRVPYEDVLRAGDWTVPRLSMLEKDLGWRAPDWLCDPLDDPGAPPQSLQPLGLGLLELYWARRYARNAHHPAVLARMKQCDGLLVCGIEGSILANLSGKPYVIWPHGGDMLIAAGLLQPPLRRVRERIHHGVLRRQLEAAFAHALCIGNHEPTGICADYFGAETYLRKQKVGFVPIPIPVRPRLRAADRRKALHAIAAEFGVQLPVDALVGFVPSRVDYEWKGQDRLLRTLARLKQDGEGGALHLIFSGWGNDFAKAREFANANGLAGMVTFLDSALSKPLLFRFYGSADFVVDQFIIGMYGTAALEAMACGAPVLTWLNESYERPWGIPPIINARSEDELHRTLREIIAGRTDLEGMGRSLQEWMDRVHNPATVVRDLLARYRAQGPKHALPA